MKWLIFPAVIVLIFVLILFVRIGVQVTYGAKRLQVRMKLGRIWYQLYPRNRKKSHFKSSPQKAGKGAGDGTAKEKSVDFWEKKDQIIQMLSLICETAGRLTRKIRIDELKMDLLWSAPDPAACGIGFGTVNALTGMMWPVFEQNFNVRTYRIRTDVDFDQGRPELHLKLLATLTIGQAIALGAGVLLPLMKRQKDHPDSKQEIIMKQKEAV